MTLFRRESRLVLESMMMMMMIWNNDGKWDTLWVCFTVWKRLHIEFEMGTQCWITYKRSVFEVSSEFVEVKKKNMQWREEKGRIEFKKITLLHKCDFHKKTILKCIRNVILCSFTWPTATFALLLIKRNRLRGNGLILKVQGWKERKKEQFQNVNCRNFVLFLHLSLFMPYNEYIFFFAIKKITCILDLFIFDFDTRVVIPFQAQNHRWGCFLIRAWKKLTNQITLKYDYHDFYERS